MNKVILLLLISTILTACGNGNNTVNTSTSNQLNYPNSTKEDIVDNYFSSLIPDPYQWMESTNSLQTKLWVEQQNLFSDNYLQTLPEYSKVKNFLQPISSAMQKFEDKNTKRSAILVNRVYYYINTYKINQNTYPALQHQQQNISSDNKIYVTDSLQNEGKVFLDLKKLKIVTGTVNDIQVEDTPDNKYLVIRSQDVNLDIGSIKVMNYETGEWSPNDQIENVYGLFTIYNDGFFYVKALNITDVYTSSYKQQKLYYHEIGTTQDSDKEIFSTNELLTINLYSSPYYNLIYFQTNIDTNSQIYRFDPNNMTVAPSLFIGDNYQSSYSLYSTYAGKLLVLTSNGAAQQRLISVNQANPQENWENILPTNNSDVVNLVYNCGRYYYAKIIKNGSSLLYRYNPNLGEEQQIALPGVGDISNFSCDDNDSSIFEYQYSNLITPEQLYSYNPQSNISQLVNMVNLKGELDSNDYEMKQVIVPARDGAEISIFMAYKKGLKLDGSNPSYLYVYGGFDLPTLPSFYTNSSILLKNNGIYVIAQVRGGGEKSLDWYNQGRLFNKQNTYNDVIDVANYLITNKYTNPNKLALGGASNGGLTTAAVTLEQADLFKVVFPAVGVMDLLRYQLFTLGYSWYSDYGYSSNQEEFNNLIQFSPLQNVKNQTYPAMLIQTGMEDGRVPPLHSYKFAATMQNSANGPSPYLLKSYPNQGHFAANSTNAQIDAWTFFFHETNSPVQ